MYSPLRIIAEYQVSIIQPLQNPLLSFLLPMPNLPFISFLHSIPAHHKCLFCCSFPRPWVMAAVLCFTPMFPVRMPTLGGHRWWCRWPSCIPLRSLHCGSFQNWAHLIASPVVWSSSLIGTTAGDWNAKVGSSLWEVIRLWGLWLHELTSDHRPNKKNLSY